MADVLKEIRHLVALAGSDNPNEARNAAFEACKRIREHDVVLSLPGSSAATINPAMPPPPPGPWSPNAPPVVPHRRGFANPEKYELVRIKNPVRCGMCSEIISPHEMAYWSRSASRALHVGCFYRVRGVGH
jgi:hypothetical protein